VPTNLHDDRYFDPEPAVRAIARELFASVRDEPLVCPHGHVDPALFARNEPFSDPVELIVWPDHYLFRMLHSRGIPLESLGVRARDGEAVETDRRKIWQIFADNFFLFAGTPTGMWLSHEFAEVFGITEKLGPENAQSIYDQIDAVLKTPEFLPRSLHERFDIAVLTTTDRAADRLEFHQAIRDSGWGGRVIPCFRPDEVIDMAGATWRASIDELSEVSGMAIGSYKDFVRAIEQRREFFKSMGARSTDQGVLSPLTAELSAAKAEAVFGRALRGKASARDAGAFTAHMLVEMARMSIDDGLVMQIHPGSYRNHNNGLFERFGPDRGADIPVRTEFTRNLRFLLNKHGSDPCLSLIVFTLDESAYSRELAPLAGHYPALKLGPPWWFHDSLEGMLRFREAVTGTAGIYNTVGFNDDTRSLPSIPARHDLSRRVDANWLARLCAAHVIDRSDAQRMMGELASGLAKSAYKL